MCVCGGGGGGRLQQFDSSRLPDTWVYFLYNLPVTLDHVVHKNAQPLCLCLTMVCPTRTLSHISVWQCCGQLTVWQCFDQLWLTMVCPTGTLSHISVWQCCGQLTVWQCFDQLWLFDNGVYNIFHLDVHYVCMLVQHFELQGRRFTNFHY